MDTLKKGAVLGAAVALVALVPVLAGKPNSPDDVDAGPAIDAGSTVEARKPRSCVIENRVAFGAECLVDAGGPR
jgi:hypothetical protein